MLGPPVSNCGLRRSRTERCGEESPRATANRRRSLSQPASLSRSLPHRDARASACFSQPKSRFGGIARNPLDAWVRRPPRFVNAHTDVELVGCGDLCFATCDRISRCAQRRPTRLASTDRQADAGAITCSRERTFVRSEDHRTRCTESATRSPRVVS